VAITDDVSSRFWPAFIRLIEGPGWRGVTSAQSLENVVTLFHFISNPSRRYSIVFTDLGPLRPRSIFTDRDRVSTERPVLGSASFFEKT